VMIGVKYISLHFITSKIEYEINISPNSTCFSIFSLLCLRRQCCRRIFELMHARAFRAYMKEHIYRKRCSSFSSCLAKVRASISLLFALLALFARCQWIRYRSCV